MVFLGFSQVQLYTHEYTIHVRFGGRLFDRAACAIGAGRAENVLNIQNILKKNIYYVLVYILNLVLWTTDLLDLNLVPGTAVYNTHVCTLEYAVCTQYLEYM